MKVLIVNQKQYQLIENMKKFEVYSRLSNLDKKIVDGLIENHVLLRVGIKRAKELGFQEKGGELKKSSISR